MMIQRILIITLTTTLILSATAVDATTAPAVNQFPINAVNQKATPETLVKIKEFWNGLTVIKASITQTNSDGEKVTGTLWLKKGKNGNEKLRLDYQSDYKQQFFIKNSEVLLVDLTDNSVAAYPLSMTPAYLMLKLNLNFDKDVKIIDSLQQGDDVQVVLAHPDDENGGRLTLFFNLKGGGHLLRWKVIDPHGNITEVDLSQESLQLNDPSLVPDSLFE